MAGPDEARARQVLGDMLERLNRGPQEALGVSFEATQADIRSAFLGLTKQYHPARFARMSSDVQRLANEVFLALRIAHDQLMRPAPKGPSRTASPLRPRPSQPPPNVRAGTSPGISPGTVPPPNKPASGELPRSSAIDRAARSSSRPPPEPVRPGSSSVDRVGRTSRPPEPAPPADASGRFTPRGPTATPTGPTPTAPPPPGAADRELATVLEQLQRGQFEPAQRTLAALAARSPGSAKYKALIAYSKGREAQLARRVDEARVELQQALQLDPDLQLAKTALAELFTRRK
ncbi:MAG: hypothetical protein AB7P03_20645 [Kofleriaceae bacterium]